MRQHMFGPIFVLSKIGHPDVFVAMLYYPKWRAMTHVLIPEHSSRLRPLISARVLSQVQNTSLHSEQQRSVQYNYDSD